MSFFDEFAYGRQSSAEATGQGRSDAPSEEALRSLSEAMAIFHSAGNVPTATEAYYAGAESIIVVPKRHIDGPATDPGMLSFYNQVFDELRATDLPPELPKGDVRRAQIAAIREVALKTGLELGVDLSARLPAADRFHFYGPKEMDELRAKYGKPPDWRGGIILVGPIATDIICEEGTVPEVLNSISHEMWHMLRYQQVRIVFDGQTPVPVSSQSGLTNDVSHAFNGWEEIGTETINRYSKKYWQDSPLLREHVYSPSYPEDVLLGHLIVDRTARATNMSPEKVWRAAWRDGLTGNKKQSMQLLRQGLGSAGLKSLANYTDHISSNAFTAVLRGLGMESDFWAAWEESGQST